MVNYETVVINFSVDSECATNRVIIHKLLHIKRIVDRRIVTTNCATVPDQWENNNNNNKEANKP